MNLPKPYLSHTQMSLWLKSPEQYKQQYFEGHRFEPTPYMRHGQAIAKLIEQNHESVRFVPRLRYPEHEIRTVIAGVPTLSYLDSFDTNPYQFLEYKTSKNKWDSSMVESCDQLRFYACAIKAVYGSLPELCHLVWLRTSVVSEIMDERGVTWQEIGDGRIILTGEAQMFPKVFTAGEIDLFEQKIREIAEQISLAYADFLG